MSRITSDELTDEEVRETAVLLIASDSTLCDGLTAEDALLHARGLYGTLNNDPQWADGKHSGDCTNEPHTCLRCLIEEAEREARARFNDDAREETARRALQGMSDAVHTQIRGQEHPLLDHVWWALEVADRVLEGAGYEEALGAFVSDDEMPERWKKEVEGK